MFIFFVYISITPKRFKDLAKECADLFPGETVSRFYIPRKPAVGELKPIQPRGVLYDKYHTIIRFLRKHGERESIRDKHSEENDNSDDVDGELWLFKVSLPKFFFLILGTFILQMQQF